jgi:hypothetical protein
LNNTQKFANVSHCHLHATVLHSVEKTERSRSRVFLPAA